MPTITDTRTNLQIVKDSFAEFQKGNIPAIIDVCTEDVVWGTFDNPVVTPSGLYRGKAGVMQFFSDLDKSTEFNVFEPREFFGEGDNICVLGYNEGRVKSTQNTFRNNWCFVFKLRNRRIYSYFGYTDTYSQYKAFEK
jgi:uncharacterized protein